MTDHTPHHLPAADEWAAAFQRQHGREPSMSEFQSAQAAGQIRSDGPSASQQFSDGARQMAAGAKSFYESHVAPAAQRAAHGAQQFADRTNQQLNSGSAGGPAWLRYAPMVLPGAAALGILSLFLPVATFFGFSANYFTFGETSGLGIALLLVFLAVIVLSILALRAPQQRGLLIASGVVGAVAGLFALLQSIGVMAEAGSTSGAALGFGTIVLFLVALALIAASVFTFLRLRGLSGQTRPAQAPYSGAPIPPAGQPGLVPPAPYNTQVPPAPQNTPPAPPAPPAGWQESPPAAPASEVPPVPPVPPAPENPER